MCVFKREGKGGADAKAPSRGKLLFAVTCACSPRRRRVQDLSPDAPDSYILILSCSCQSRYEALGMRNEMASLLSSNCPKIGHEKCQGRHAHTALQMRSRPTEVYQPVTLVSPPWRQWWDHISCAKKTLTWTSNIWILGSSDNKQYFPIFSIRRYAC